MNQPIIGSQVLRLRQDLAAAVGGRELLDRKREALVRALADRLPQLEALRRDARTRLAAARSALADAQLELGRAAIHAAALAQPAWPPAIVSEGAVVGVTVPQIQLAPIRFVAHYGPASGSASLDRAGTAFVDAVAPLVRLAAAEEALRRLRRALARTSRRLNALDRELIPTLRERLRSLLAALEEEERDDTVRRKVWLARSDQADVRAGAVS